MFEYGTEEKKNFTKHNRIRHKKYVKNMISNEKKKTNEK